MFLHLRRNGVSADSTVFRHFVVKRADVSFLRAQPGGGRVVAPSQRPGARKMISIWVENPEGAGPSRKAREEEFEVQLSRRVSASSMMSICLNVEDLAVNRVSLRRSIFCLGNSGNIVVLKGYFLCKHFKGCYLYHRCCLRLSNARWTTSSPRRM